MVRLSVVLASIVNLQLRKSLAQGQQMARWCIAKIAQGLVQHDQQEMQPFVDVGLGHAKQRAVGNLQRGYFQIAQQEQQAIFLCRQRRIDIRAVGTRRTRERVSAVRPSGRSIS